MPLPAAWIDRIFDKLTLTYGKAFVARWQDLDLAYVKADWLHALDGMERHPEAIAFALANVGDKPPTVVEFRALCRRAPLAAHAQLAPPPADPARAAGELARLAPLLKARPAPRVDGKGWARAIVQQADAGARIAPGTLRFAREALVRETRAHEAPASPARQPLAEGV